MSFLASASGSSSSRTVAQSVGSLSTRARSTSTMGIPRKVVNQVKKAAPRETKRRSDIDEPWYFNYVSKLPVLKEGKLSTVSPPRRSLAWWCFLLMGPLDVVARPGADPSCPSPSPPCFARLQRALSSLVDLYHSTATHVTRENLDDVIDAEFAPVSGVPNTRPQMASLIDLHLEMNDPGFYSRPENDWRRIKAESALASGSTDGIENQFRNLAGTALENALPPSAASAPGTGSDVSQRQNDWVGARERELTPRQWLVVEALYGTDADRRPGLEAISERLMAETEVDALARAKFVAGQKAVLADAGDAVVTLNTDIALEPHVYKEEAALTAEEDPVAAEGVAEGGDVAPEDILTKEVEPKP